MPNFEYKVIPAPVKGVKARGIRSAEARFAHALSTAMNDLGAQGWSYVRADTLPAEERVGLTKTKTVYHNMLVFRRDRVDAEEVDELQTVTQVTAPQSTPLEQAFMSPKNAAHMRAYDTTDDDADAPPVASILTVLQARRAEVKVAQTPTDIAAE